MVGFLVLLLLNGSVINVIKEAVRLWDIFMLLLHFYPGLSTGVFSEKTQAVTIIQNLGFHFISYPEMHCFFRHNVVHWNPWAGWRCTCRRC